MIALTGPLACNRAPEEEEKIKKIDAGRGILRQGEKLGLSLVIVLFLTPKRGEGVAVGPWSQRKALWGGGGFKGIGGGGAHVVLLWCRGDTSGIRGVEEWPITALAPSVRGAGRDSEHVLFGIFTPPKELMLALSPVT